MSSFVISLMCFCVRAFIKRQSDSREGEACAETELVYIVRVLVRH
ncbi:hypothetical protein LP7551_00206 [Roseibium album]|nr:hypothetical protein LP7551_00206 [Roseibium album]